MIKFLGNYLEFNSYFYKNFLKILEHNFRNINRKLKKKKFWSFTFALFYRQNGHFEDYPQTSSNTGPRKEYPSCGKDAPAGEAGKMKFC